VIAASGLGGVYDNPVDRESAYERLKGRAATSPPAALNAPATSGSWTDSLRDSLGGLISGSGRKDSIVEAGKECRAHRRLDDRAGNRPRRPRIAAREP
jgi:hypothetical protein